MPIFGGTVVVTRLKRGGRFFGSMTVEIDGRSVGKLSRGQTDSYQVVAGDHYVQTKFRSTRKSERLMIQVGVESTVKLECTHDRIGYPILRFVPPSSPETASV
jgi:hypothetical protein